MARYFLDTEFIENGRTIDLLSIGLVAEDGREFYAQNYDCAVGRANGWVVANVFPHLAHFQGRDTESGCGCAGDERGCPWHSRTSIAHGVEAFVAAGQQDRGAPEFWGYYVAYDWVALCQLFGDMSTLPSGWPMLAYDLRQLLDRCGHRTIRQPDDAPHHALSDARWIRDTFLAHDNGALEMLKG